MPETLELEESRGRTRGYRLTTNGTYPERRVSRRLSFGGLRLPWRSWRFGVFAAALYMFYAWILQSASKWLGTEVLGAPSLMDKLLTLPFSPDSLGPALRASGRVLAHAPASVFFSLLILGGLIAFCSAKNAVARALVGGAHAAAHILLNLGLLWAFARCNGARWPIDSWQQVTAFVLEMLVAGLFLGGWLMALYLLLCSFLGGFHTEELFSSQRIPDYKNFLRLHLSTTGKLEVYAVAVPRACRKWRLNPQATTGAPWFDPQDGRPIACHLIESIVVD
jgi:hypothetical protein